MKIFKLALTSILTISLLAGCGGDDTANTIKPGEAGKVLYETTSFSLIVPQDWETLTKDNFTSNVPQETVVAFRNNVKSDSFTANLNVIQTALDKSVSSEDFAKSSKARIKTSLVGYNEISTENVEVLTATPDTTVPGTIVHFTAKKTGADPTISFDQLFVNYNGQGYVITAAYLPDEDSTVVTYTQEMLNSLTLK